MKLTESQLRGLIKQVLIEASEGPAVLKNASTNVVAAINENDPAAFWGSVEGVIEGLIMVMQHAPGTEGEGKQRQASQFITAAQQLAAVASRFKVNHQAQASRQQRGPQTKKAA